MTESSLKQIEQLADQLSFEEQLTLIEHLAQRVRRQAPGVPPQELYGIWRDRFPSDFDLDTALSNIRSQWEHNLLPVSKQ